MVSTGAPLRAIQEWMGHNDRTTLIYADYAPDLSQGAVWAARAFPEDLSIRWNAVAVAYGFVSQLRLLRICCQY
jgi:hypothetical protein